jgi:hypothetical protein
MTHFEWLIIIKSSDFLAILKNNKNFLKKYKIWSPTRFSYKKYFDRSDPQFEL